jgi:hypothetical protein
VRVNVNVHLTSGDGVRARVLLSQHREQGRYVVVSIGSHNLELCGYEGYGFGPADFVAMFERLADEVRSGMAALGPVAEVSA